MCCGSWDRKESDTTERLNRTELKVRENPLELKKNTWRCNSRRMGQVRPSLADINPGFSF